MVRISKRSVFLLGVPDFVLINKSGDVTRHYQEDPVKVTNFTFRNKMNKNPIL